MPAGNHQRESRLILFMAVILSDPERREGESKDLRFGLQLLQQYRVNMPFQMIDGNQRQPLRKGQRLGVRNPHQQRPRQSRPGGYGNRVQIPQRDPRLRQRRAHHRHNRPQMLPAGQLRHHPAVARMRGDLRCHHRR